MLNMYFWCWFYKVCVAELYQFRVHWFETSSLQKNHESKKYQWPHWSKFSGGSRQQALSKHDQLDWTRNMIVAISIIICWTQNSSCLDSDYIHTSYCPKETGTLREAGSPLRKSQRGIAKNRENRGIKLWVIELFNFPYHSTQLLKK